MYGETDTTHIAVATTENTYRGTTAKIGINAWILIETEYNVGILLPATERLNRTMRNLPKLPKGRNIASSSPPTFPPLYPCSQAGTEDAATATAAPKH